MTLPRTIVVCQARTGSTRLPGKVMLPVAGAPMILRFMERVRRATLPTEVVVATTTLPSDDGLARLCEQHGFHVFRGHETDLLDRHLRCAEAYHADVVVKVPSDCPLIDPEIIDTVIAAYLEREGRVDFVSNLHPDTFPDGNDVEVMSMQVLRDAHRTAIKPHDREHTTPWMWDGNPHVRCLTVQMPDGKDLSLTHRWTVDHPEDYMLVRSVYEALYSQNPFFSFNDILLFLKKHPEIHLVNRHLAGVTWYRPPFNPLSRPA